MVEGLPDMRTILNETDWSRLEHGGGPADPETPAKLANLVSGDPSAVTIALNHLWDDVLHQGSLYSATPAAALYVAAVLGESHNKVILSASNRSKLLGWLAEVVYEVSLGRERQREAWIAPDSMDDNPLFGEVRRIRPALFRGVYPCISDSDLDVVEAALLVAVHLLDDPELRSYREVIAPKVRTISATSSWQGYRTAAISGLAAWGEDVESLQTSAEPAEKQAGSQDDFWSADRGPIDEPPF